MLEDYGRFGTEELWNNRRFIDYHRRGLGDQSLHVDCEACKDLPLAQGPYIDPVTDLAPFYDPSYPESGDAIGILVRNTLGFDTLGSRELATTPFGTVSSRRNLDPKTVTVEAVLSGSTCESVQYLYRWLLARLMERDCEDNVEVSMLSMYDCCPSDPNLSPEDIDDKYLRHMYRVRVAQDPTIVERLGNCCGGSCQSTSLVVQWTFVLENPKLYRNVDLCLEGSVWPEETVCVDFDCVVCPDTPTFDVEVVREKKRFPVQVLSNGRWCPVGDWQPNEYFDDPTKGYLDIVQNDIEPNPLNIYIGFDGTWGAFHYQQPFVHLDTINLCDIDIQITGFFPQANPDGVPPASDWSIPGGGPLVKAPDVVDLELPIRLTADTFRTGTWEPIGWSYNQYEGLPPSTRFVIDNGCDCVESSLGICNIILNENLTWNPEDPGQFIGTFPPLGCGGVAIQGQSPGTYIDREELPLENIFSGDPIAEVAVGDSYAGSTATYVQPLEWMQQCCKIEFMSGVERAEPWFRFEAGSNELYNFRADFYQLLGPEDFCVCDEDLTPEQIMEWECREPDFSVKAGRAIPSNSMLVYEPRTRQIKGIRGNEVFDATGIVSGKNGGSPYFFEFPQCYGVCVVFTAEVRRDEDDEIVSPALDSKVTAGHIPFVYVGV